MRGTPRQAVVARAHAPSVLDKQLSEAAVVQAGQETKQATARAQECRSAVMWARIDASTRMDARMHSRTRACTRACNQLQRAPLTPPHPHRAGIPEAGRRVPCCCMCRARKRGRDGMPLACANGRHAPSSKPDRQWQPRRARGTTLLQVQWQTGGPTCPSPPLTCTSSSLQAHPPASRASLDWCASSIPLACSPGSSIHHSPRLFSQLLHPSFPSPVLPAPPSPPNSSTSHAT